MKPPEPRSSPSRIAVIGGGTGLPVVLRGLKAFVGGEVGQLTGIVTVTDDGGSSGRLRREFGVLPPGDIRNCIVALSDDEAVLSKLFQYRFPAGQGLSGHSFGNLLLTALTELTGDFYQAILTAESILSVRGKVLPATLSDGRLRAKGASGKVYEGESEVGHAGEPLEELALDPPDLSAFEPAARALEDADLILLGPGSLYTSILPNLLIPGILEAIRRSRAPVVLVLNLMTQPGETDAMSAVDHVEALERQTGASLVDKILVHGGPWPQDCLETYARAGSTPVAVDPGLLEARGVTVVEKDLLAEGALLRHDPAKLGRAALSLAAPSLETRSSESQRRASWKRPAAQGTSGSKETHRVRALV